MSRIPVNVGDGVTVILTSYEDIDTNRVARILDLVLEVGSDMPNPTTFLQNDNRGNLAIFVFDDSLPSSIENQFKEDFIDSINSGENIIEYLEDLGYFAEYLVD